VFCLPRPRQRIRGVAAGARGGEFETVQIRQEMLDPVEAAFKAFKPLTE
jgi:hypothetical protein